MPLSNSQKKHLRGLSHDLNPVVMVADKGLSDNVLAEVEQALVHHELIKIKLRGDREQRREWIAALSHQTGAEVVHQVGQVVCLFRRNPEKPRVEFPR